MSRKNNYRRFSIAWLRRRRFFYNAYSLSERIVSLGLRELNVHRI
ncbi:hypothetical protein Goklo_025058, partial [Gossypium klotzschianum]|nr:hypothetical protein [Gossypium klotzschianum]